MDLLFALILLVLLCVGLYALLNADLPAILVMAAILALAFVLGGLLATSLNWSDAPTVVAIAVAGGFLWRELRQIREELQAGNRRTSDDAPEREPGTDTSAGEE